MTLPRLTRILVRHKIEFSFEYDENGEYYLDIILGNREYLVHEHDELGIEELWDDLKNYWLYN